MYWDTYISGKILTGIRCRHFTVRIHGVLFSERFEKGVSRYVYRYFWCIFFFHFKIPHLRGTIFLYLFCSVVAVKTRNVYTFVLYLCARSCVRVFFFPYLGHRHQNKTFVSDFHSSLSIFYSVGQEPLVFSSLRPSPHQRHASLFLTSSADHVPSTI